LKQFAKRLSTNLHSNPPQGLRDYLRHHYLEDLRGVVKVLESERNPLGLWDALQKRLQGFGSRFARERFGLLDADRNLISTAKVLLRAARASCLARHGIQEPSDLDMREEPVGRYAAGWKAWWNRQWTPSREEVTVTLPVVFYLTRVDGLEGGPGILARF